MEVGLKILNKVGDNKELWKDVYRLFGLDVVKREIGFFMLDKILDDG